MLPFEFVERPKNSKASVRRNSREGVLRAGEQNDSVLALGPSRDSGAPPRDAPDGPRFFVLQENPDALRRMPERHFHVVRRAHRAVVASYAKVVDVQVNDLGT